MPVNASKNGALQVARPADTGACEGLRNMPAIRSWLSGLIRSHNFLR